MAENNNLLTDQLLNNISTQFSTVITDLNETKKAIELTGITSSGKTNTLPEEIHKIQDKTIEKLKKAKTVDGLVDGEFNLEVGMLFNNFINPESYTDYNTSLIPMSDTFVFTKPLGFIWPTIEKMNKIGSSINIAKRSTDPKIAAKYKDRDGNKPIIKAIFKDNKYHISSLYMTAFRSPVDKMPKNYDSVNYRLSVELIDDALDIGKVSQDLIDKYHLENSGITTDTRFINMTKNNNVEVSLPYYHSDFSINNESINSQSLLRCDKFRLCMHKNIKTVICKSLSLNRNLVLASLICDKDGTNRTTINPNKLDIYLDGDILVSEDFTVDPLLAGDFKATTMVSNNDATFRILVDKSKVSMKSLRNSSSALPLLQAIVLTYDRSEYFDYNTMTWKSYTPNMSIQHWFEYCFRDIFKEQYKIGVTPSNTLFGWGNNANESSIYARSYLEAKDFSIFGSSMELNLQSANRTGIFYGDYPISNRYVTATFNESLVKYVYIAYKDKPYTIDKPISYMTNRTLMNMSTYTDEATSKEIYKINLDKKAITGRSLDLFYPKYQNSFRDKVIEITLPIDNNAKLNRWHLQTMASFGEIKWLNTKGELIERINISENAYDKNGPCITPFYNRHIKEVMLTNVKLGFDYVLAEETFGKFYIDETQTDSEIEEPVTPMIWKLDGCKMGEETFGPYKYRGSKVSRMYLRLFKNAKYVIFLVNENDPIVRDIRACLIGMMFYNMDQSKYWNYNTMGWENASDIALYEIQPENHPDYETFSNEYDIEGGDSFDYFS